MASQLIAFTADQQESADIIGPGFSFAVIFSGTPIDCVVNVLRLNPATSHFDVIDSIVPRASNLVAYINESFSATYRLKVYANGRPVALNVEVVNG